MRQHPFSMIEIILALGVVAVGICSIMVLFPVGAAANRDAQAETYIANTADQILHLVKYNLTSSETKWNNLVKTTTAALPVKTKEDVKTLDSTIQSHVGDTSQWSIPSNENTIVGQEIQGNVFAYGSAATNTFLLVSHHDNAHQNGAYSTIDPGTIDFRAVAILWRSQIKVNNTGDDSKDYLAYDYGVTLNLKVFWPAELPPAAQQSTIYTLDVYKPTF